MFRLPYHAFETARFLVLLHQEEQLQWVAWWSRNLGLVRLSEDAARAAAVIQRQLEGMD